MWVCFSGHYMCFSEFDWRLYALVQWILTKFLVQWILKK